MNAAVSPRSIGNIKVPVGSEQCKRNFLPFSHDTFAKDGRNVFIDTALLPKFLSLIDPQSFDGKMIIKRIIQLKALAAGIGSAANINDQFMYMDKIKHVQVIYQVRATSDNEEVSVYITDIRPAFDGDEVKFGLYRVLSNGSVNTSQQCSVVLENLATMSSGQDSSISEAIKTSSAYMRGSFGKRQDYSMVYVPSHMRNDLGAWITPEMKSFSTEQAAYKLADYLAQTSRKRESMRNAQAIEWVVQGESAKLLSLAVKNIKELLGYHSFKFVDPTTDISPLLGTLKRLNASLSEEPVIYTNNRPSKLAMSTIGNSISNALKSMGHDSDASKIKNIASNTTENLNRISAIYTSALASKNEKTLKSYTFLDGINQFQGSASW